MKFYGQFDPPLDKVIYERYFKDKKHGLCVEAGAVDGVNLSTCKFFEDSLKWGCINIEPHPESFKSLCDNRPKSLNLNMALSDHDGTGLLRHGPNFILRAALVDKKVNSRKRKYEYTEVTTISFKSLMKKYAVTNIDLMVLDVEGKEVEVLKGMEGACCMPSVLCVEFNHAGLNNVTAAAQGLGYKLDFSYKINAMFIK